ncbi:MULTISPECIES: chemotaxis protein CheW [Rufibacter]|uniref:Purine-binding chemotaxis protein CheW n=1 Tax=Rufibacter quisquiliarum TaxID=1549639 RepID=A0A839GUB9_9BACT|nr:MULTISPECIES: chemotaxis protein CheW [Rufibacter]MBA9078008.1 purine-binding chemotaxis protein CheW [Rufibacter quisquiliarum]
MESQNIRDKKEAAVEVKVHLIVFKLGTEEYGVRIDQVKEVTITPEITRMPKTPSFIKGVSNIRGDIIAIMDLEERFNIERSTAGTQSKHTYTLVMEAKDYTMGFIVREVPQSLSLPVSSIDKAPSFIQDININENFIEGIGKIDDRLIIVLDIYKILTSEEIMELKS